MLAFRAREHNQDSQCQWEEEGVWLEAWRTFLQQLSAALSAGKIGGIGVGKTKRGKGTKWMVVVDGECAPLGATSPVRSRRKSPTSCQ